jgi:uncharacterized coiled-coil DUF342 family protein
MGQKAVTPGEELIEQLDSLRIKLESLSERLDRSGVERTNGLRQIMGRECDYYRKSLDIFLHKDYIDLRNMVKDIHQLFEVVDGQKG